MALGAGLGSPDPVEVGECVAGSAARASWAGVPWLVIDIWGYHRAMEGTEVRSLAENADFQQHTEDDTLDFPRGAFGQGDGSKWELHTEAERFAQSSERRVQTSQVWKIDVPSKCCGRQFEERMAFAMCL